MARKICVVTGTRVEYGLIYWLMNASNKIFYEYNFHQKQEA